MIFASLMVAEKIIEVERNEELERSGCYDDCSQ